MSLLLSFYIFLGWTRSMGLWLPLWGSWEGITNLTASIGTAPGSEELCPLRRLWLQWPKAHQWFTVIYNDVSVIYRRPWLLRRLGKGLLVWQAGAGLDFRGPVRWGGPSTGDAAEWDREEHDLNSSVSLALRDLLGNSLEFLNLPYVF